MALLYSKKGNIFQWKIHCEVCLLIIKRSLKTTKKTINNNYFLSNFSAHSATLVGFPFNWPRLIHYFIMSYMEKISFRRSSRCSSQLALNIISFLFPFQSLFSLSVSLLFSLFSPLLLLWSYKFYLPINAKYALIKDQSLYFSIVSNKRKAENKTDKNIDRQVRK